jgi:predicted PurR-regulated permease PerM
MNPRRPSGNRTLWLGVFVAVALGLVWLLSPILSPFLFAAILAYICNPLVGRLEHRHVPRTVGTLLVMALLVCAFAALLLITLPLLQKETALLVKRVPAYASALADSALPWLRDRLGVDLAVDAQSLREALSEHAKDAGNIAGRVLASLRIGGLAVVGFVLNLILVPVVLFYLLRDWNGLVARIDAAIPRRWHAQARLIATETDRVLGEFLRGQLAVMLIMSAYYSTGLWLAGLEFPLPIGMLTGMLVFVPYVGMVTGLVLATLSGLMQFQALSGLVPVWIAFGVGQALEGMVITPWLVGERVGLHPVAVIFALLAFGQVFGFVGVLLALPASAALLVWLRHLGRHYLSSRLYNE